MSTEDQCQFCLKAKAKYSCPKCNILYCSVPCYQNQAHLQCSENFYRECVEQEIAAEGSSRERSESAKKMHEILQRMKNLDEADEEFFDEGSDLDSDDDALESDLACRLDGVDLNDPEAIWNKLTSSERQEFESIVHGGDISNLLPLHTPWWVENQEKKLIQEASTSEEISHPQIMSNIKSFKEISTKAPAPCVRHNLTNILAAYSITLRHFNGDFLCVSQEFSSFLVTICGNIKSNSNYDSEDLALESVAHEARNAGVPMDKEDVRMMREDVEMITKKSIFILAALSDIHSTFSLARATKVKEKSSTGIFSKRFVDPEGREFKEIQRSRLCVYMKKIEFFLAYTKDIL